MTKLTKLTVIGRGRNHVETEVGGQTMMMSISKGKYYALDATAQRIWQLIEEPRPIGEVVRELVSEYDVTPQQCESDVTRFAGELMDNGLVVEITDGTWN